MGSAVNAPYVFCLYADDIRQEVSEKVSLMGIYQGGMNVAGPAPQALPKLVVSAFFNTPVDYPVSDVSIDVVLGDEVLQKIALPSETVREAQASLRKNPTVRHLSMQMVCVLQPLVITGDGTLRVRVRADSETFESNGLEIKMIALQA